MTAVPPRVVAAAIRSEATGEVFSLPPPARHHSVIALMADRFDQRDEQGFLLSDGRFARRKAAYVVAVYAGQLVDGDGTAPQHGLFSEDLW